MNRLAIVVLCLTVSGSAAVGFDRLEALMREVDEALDPPVDLERAEVVGLEALLLAGDLERHAEQAQTAYRLASAHMGMGRLAEAFDIARVGLRAAQRSEDPTAIAWAWEQMGNAYFHLSRYPEALGCFEQSRDRFHRLDDRGGLAVALKNVGITQRYVGAYDLSLPYLHDAVALFRKLGQTDNLISALANLGTTYGYLASPDRELKCYLDALEMAQPTENPELIGDLLTRLGFTRLDSGRDRQAVDDFTEALRWYDGEGFPGYRAWTLMGLAQAQASVGMLREGLASIDASMDLNREMGEQVGIADCLRIRAELLAESDPQAARIDLERSHRMLEGPG